MRITNPFKETHLLICADFDEKCIRLRAFDSKGNLFNDGGLNVSVNNNSSTCVYNLIESIHNYITQLGHDLKQITGLGVSCPGIIGVRRNDVTFFNANCGKISLGTELKREFNRPVILENNGHAAAWGEKISGVGLGFTTFIYIFVDDSVGGGIVLENRLFRGATNSAALFGHTIVKPNGKKCVCGNNGCLESYVSSHGLADTIRKNTKICNLKSLKSSTLSNRQFIEVVNSLAHDGNALPNSLLKEAGRYLGMVMYNSCILIAPNAIIVSGEVFAASDRILQYMQEYLTIALPNIECYRGGKGDSIPIIKSELNQDSRFFGVANLFLETIKKRGLQRR